MIRKYAKHSEYIKADNNKILNLNYIKWIKKIDECMEICMKGDGCYVGDTQKICKINHPDSYEKLNKHFD